MKMQSDDKYEIISERYVDIKKVSKYTSLPVKTQYEWSGLGKIPSIKIGRRVLFDLHDIDKVMASMKRTSNKEEKIVNKIIGGVHGNDI
jgi:predicted DNA-binding transcriptional regulator AlpA